MMPSPAKAFQAGWNAAHRGWGLNPYNPIFAPDLAVAWSYGWILAFTKAFSTVH